jgi:hypothetical protein
MISKEGAHNDVNVSQGILGKTMLVRLDLG